MNKLFIKYTLVKLRYKILLNKIVLFVKNINSYYNLDTKNLEKLDKLFFKNVALL